MPGPFDDIIKPAGKPAEPKPGEKPTEGEAGEKAAAEPKQPPVQSVSPDFERVFGKRPAAS